MNLNILAIIPARAGSKGIPNKNIRIVAGHPLVEYAIKNAVNSKYISDCIVTTDSPEVKSIFQQQENKAKNLQVHWRNEALCKDDVTLDSVVFDAIPADKKYDYIVTLQPTSPTLKTQTLDKAIEYAIQNNTDTLISVINEPHLSWHEENGKKLPSYEKRLNRQYLPANYKETGAFVISKANVVTENTRIGPNVDVFELSEDEAIDVDNYSDLILVDEILQKKKIAIYANGNNQIGTGHVYRALELADGFFFKCDILYDSTKTDKSIFGNTTHNLISFSTEQELLKICKEKEYTVFINDILDTNKNYMSKLKDSLPENAKIINFEDDGEGTELADLVIDALYDFPETEHLKTGEKYYIAPKSFLLSKPIQIKSKVNTVFICFGGADPQNYTDRILKLISDQEFKSLNFMVVLGRGKSNVDELMKYSCENIQMFFDVKNMAEIISECDIAITSRGRTCYELAMLGIPTIAMAQNSREEKHNFASSENGFLYLGLNPSDKEIKNEIKKYILLTKNERIELQNKLLKHDLKKGRKIVMNLINNL